MDQVTDKQYSDSTPAVHNSYNKSWLTQVQAGSWSYNYTGFDPIGRVTDASQSITGGRTYAFHVTYKPIIGVDSITYPNPGRVVRTTYDAQGRPYGLTSQTGPHPQINFVISTSYQADGAVKTQTLGNNLVINRTDNARLQPQTIPAGSLLSLTYGYNPATNNGNVMSQTISRSGIGNWTQTYADINNQLATAQETGTWSRTYGYDTRGNLRVDANSGLALSPFTPTSATNYDAYNHLNIQNSAYDGANQTQIGGFQFQRRDRDCG